MFFKSYTAAKLSFMLNVASLAKQSFMVYFQKNECNVTLAATVHIYRYEIEQAYNGVVGDLLVPEWESASLLGTCELSVIFCAFHYVSFSFQMCSGLLVEHLRICPLPPTFYNLHENPKRGHLSVCQPNRFAEQGSAMRAALMWLWFSVC